MARRSTDSNPEYTKELKKYFQNAVYPTIGTKTCCGGLQPLSPSDPRLECKKKREEYFAREQALEEYELEERLEEKIIEENINKLKNIKIQIEIQERKKQNQVRLHVYNFNKFNQDEKIIKEKITTKGMSPKKSQALENLRSSQKAQEERRKKGIAKAIIQIQKFEENYERRKQILEKHTRKAEIKAQQKAREIEERAIKILAQKQEEEAIPQEETDLNRLEDEMKEELITAGGVLPKEIKNQVLENLQSFRQEMRKQREEKATAEGIPEDRQEQGEEKASLKIQKMEEIYEKCKQKLDEEREIERARIIRLEDEEKAREIERARIIRLEEEEKANRRKYNKFVEKNIRKEKAFLKALEIKREQLEEERPQMKRKLEDSSDTEPGHARKNRKIPVHEKIRQY